MSLHTEMDMYEALKVSREGDVGVILLDVPAKRNAMTPVLTREYPAAVRELRDDPSTVNRAALAAQQLPPSTDEAARAIASRCAAGRRGR